MSKRAPKALCCRASPRQPPIEAIEQCHDSDETGCEPRAAIARRLADQSGDTCHERYPHQRDGVGGAKSRKGMMVGNATHDRNRCCGEEEETSLDVIRAAHRL